MLEFAVISPKKCAFLTLENQADFFIYDYLAVEPLDKLGWSVVEIPWNQPDVDWSAFDAVVIRSTWDYQKAPDCFLRVLSNIEDCGTRLFNSLNVYCWNLNKGYLRDLQERGVPIVPTKWLSRLDEVTLSQLMIEFGGQNFVVKPTVGANADDTYVVECGNPNSWQEALRVFAARPLMAQPFVQSVVDEGEYSLFYFGGQFSHAIVKKPAPNDFRVQEEHGGIIQSTSVDPLFAEAGQRAVDAVQHELLYARVDLVRLAGGQPALMELELIEPSLYFSHDPQAAERFAKELDRLASAT